MAHKKKTIAIVCDKNPHTSFGRMALDFHRVLACEFNVHVIWLKTPKYFPGDYGMSADNRHSDPSTKNFHSICAPSLEAGWLMFRRPLRRLLREIGPESVLMIRPELGFLVRVVHKTLSGAWAGVLVHDMFAETLYGRSLKFRLINRFFISPAREADGFIYNSEYTRAQAARVMGLAPDGPVIGCPIDRAAFRPPAEGKAALRKKWGLDGYRGVCLNISLDEPRKNIPAYFALAAARPDVAFVRVGPFSPWMRKWIDGHRAGNIIHYSGIPQEGLVELYNCADLFVYPSLLEGFGMPPLEALACGTPAVAALTSALKENLEGVVPLIDPPERVDGYIEVIDAVLSGKDVVDRAAAEKLLARFSIEAFGKRARACFRGRE
jgi:glycosyltransferase involved in cell wall biosynthesis